jgi:hypothetical protein
MHPILISLDTISVKAHLNDTPCARKILAALPLTAAVNTWGDEIYFTIPVHAGREAGAREEVEAGDLGYWPDGDAFCIFFGPTPASAGEKPRAYSPVNIIGAIDGNATAFRGVKDGAKLTVASAS